MNEKRIELEKLQKEKRSLPDCARRRELEKKIQIVEREVKSTSDQKPEITVRYSGKVVGRLDFDQKESSWVFLGNDGTRIEVGFDYNEAKTWASITGYRLKVVA